MINKKVCIDINSVLTVIKRGHHTGIGRVCFELITALGNIDGLPFDIILYSQNARRIKAQHLALSFDSLHIDLPYRLWINNCLSYTKIRTNLSKADLWHCPHNADYVDHVNNTIFTLHDMFLYTCPNEFSEQKKKYLQQFMPPLIRSSKAVITCSESSRRDIVNFIDVDPKKVYITPWGIDHQLFKPLDDIEQAKNELREKYHITGPYFFSVSCGYGRKNTMQILQAYEKLLKNNPLNNLVVVWRDYQFDASEIIRQSNNRITCLEWVSDQDLVKLYSCATALLFPSTYEGFGMPVLEAMACGVPVVAYRNSAIPEIGGDHIIYMDEGNDLLKVMETFENGEYSLTDLKRQAFNHAAKFTWSKCAVQTADIYKQCLQQL